jgi:hypothetical protein
VIEYHVQFNPSGLKKRLKPSFPGVKKNVSFFFSLSLPDFLLPNIWDLEIKLDEGRKTLKINFLLFALHFLFLTKSME